MMEEIEVQLYVGGGWPVRFTTVEFFQRTPDGNIAHTPFCKALTTMVSRKMGGVLATDGNYRLIKLNYYEDTRNLRRKIEDLLFKIPAFHFEVVAEGHIFRFIPNEQGPYPT